MWKNHLFFVVAIVSLVAASPLRSKKDEGRVLYDQKQEGAWNVRADLENFLILLAPPAHPLSLLSLLPRKAEAHIGEQRKENPSNLNPVEETIHFIESKTAPYHVDISESKLPITPTSESSLIARSPTVSLKKSELAAVNPRASKMMRALVLRIPDEEFVITKTENKKKIAKKDGKKAIKNIYIPALTLLGTKYEDCRPGMVRDSYGICRTYPY